MVGRMGAFVLVGILVGGCSASASPSPAAEPSVASPLPSEVPSMTTASPSPSGEVWDLLWISDSVGSGGVPEAYARRVEADLGVDVNVHDQWSPGLTARTVLEVLKGTHEGVVLGWRPDIDIRQLVRDAEVIVVSGNPSDSPTKDHPWQWDCAISFEPEPACGTVTACGPETWQQYEADIEAIFDEIYRIRSVRPVILRTHDWYMAWGALETWRACDQVEVCAACWGEWSDAIHRAAATRGVPVAGYYSAFSGPDGVEPLPSAWMRDDVHPGPVGAEQLAGVMADLGYEPVAPTGH